MVETLQLVCLERVSWERDKHVWEDRGSRAWDEIIGRMYLLKANDALDDEDYATALADFEQALVFLARDGVDQSYYARALADKAFVHCFLGQYETALEIVDQALPMTNRFYQDAMLDNRGAILVLVGAFSDALNILSTQLDKNPKDDFLRFTWATCLLHLERYQEAVVAYEQVKASHSHLGDEGLVAARLGQQPDWANL
jgi:tetratricopeptide (TPR) repeat protein